MHINESGAEQLLENLRRGDEGAFLKVYDTFWYKVFSVAYKRLRDKAVAEELTQDLFLKLWEKRAQLRIEKLENYLLTSIKHAIIDYIQSGAVAEKYVEFYKAFVSMNHNSTEEIVNFDELSDAIERGLEHLPQKSQEVFRLTRLSHWPADKIAERLELSEKTVGYHLTKSIKFMQSYLRHHGYLYLLLFIS
jgi:RNA polymerase sigma-70 factor (family 1)